jgi:hypothetical protein
MSSDAKLILKRAVRTERWEHQERGDYNLDRFDQEFRERLYSDRGREILHAQSHTIFGRNDEGCHR